MSKTQQRVKRYRKITMQIFNHFWNAALSSPNQSKWPQKTKTEKTRNETFWRQVEENSEDFEQNFVSVFGACVAFHATSIYLEDIFKNLEEVNMQNWKLCNLYMPRLNTQENGLLECVSVFDFSVLGGQSSQSHAKKHTALTRTLPPPPSLFQANAIDTGQQHGVFVTFNGKPQVVSPEMCR